MPYKLSMSASRLLNTGSASDRVDRVDRVARIGSRKSNRNFMMMKSRGYRRRSMIRRRSGWVCACEVSCSRLQRVKCRVWLCAVSADLAVF